MQRIEKKLFYQGLKDYPVYKEDTDNTIFNVVNVPTIFPQGKSYFLILGSRELRQDSDVLVEILDSTGQVIYYEVPKYLENAGRAISVWIYDHITPGEANVTILGELERVPNEWKNKPNIKQSFRIYVNPQIVNKEPIKFSVQPEVTASYVERSYLYWTKNISTLNTFNLHENHKTFFGAPYLSDSSYLILIMSSGYPYVPVTESGFDQYWSGAIFEAYDVTLSDGYVVPYYKGTIVDRKSNITYVVSSALVSYQSMPPMVTATDLTSNPDANIKYYVTDTGSSSELTASFVELKIKNLFTFSGDVDKIRIYKQNLSSETQYYLLGEYPATPTELLVRSGSLNYMLGRFDSTGSIQQWTYCGLDNRSFDDPPFHFIYEAPTIETNSLVLNNSVKLTPRYALGKSPLDPYLYSEDVRRFKFYPKDFSIYVPKGHEYTIKAKYFCEPSNLVFNYSDFITTNLSASLGIYVSGSAINPDKNQGYFNYNDIIEYNDLGKKIGLLTSNTTRNFGEVEFNVVTNRAGDFTVSFVVFSGVWYIADISIMASTDPGFNPDELTIYAPLSNLKREEFAKFKVEFLNTLGEPSVDFSETSRPVQLINQPIYVERDDNLILGTLAVSKLPGQGGIAISGVSGSSIISDKYFGMQPADLYDSGGFAAYSGSIFPDYRGVGFELNAGLGTGSLDFRFDPPAGSYLNISASIFALPGSNIGGKNAICHYTAAHTWSFQHDLEEKFVNIQTYNLYDEKIIPQKIVVVDSNSADIYFNTPAAGTAVATYGGYVGPRFPRNVSIGGIASDSFYNLETWSLEHNLSYQYVVVQAYDLGGYQMVPSNIRLINENKVELYFTPSASGTAVASIGGSSIIKQATLTLVCSDETTQLVPKNDIITFYMPYALDLVNVKASLNMTGSTPTLINVKSNNVNIFDTPMAISASSYVSTRYTNAARLKENDRISIDLLSVSTGSAGLKVYLVGY